MAKLSVGCSFDGYTAFSSLTPFISTFFFSLHPFVLSLVISEGKDCIVHLKQLVLLKYRALHMYIFSTH